MVCGVWQGGRRRRARWWVVKRVVDVWCVETYTELEVQRAFNMGYHYMGCGVCKIHTVWHSCDCMQSRWSFATKSHQCRTLWQAHTHKQTTKTTKACLSCKGNKVVFRKGVAQTQGLCATPHSSALNNDLSRSSLACLCGLGFRHCSFKFKRNSNCGAIVADNTAQSVRPCCKTTSQWLRAWCLRKQESVQKSPGVEAGLVAQALCFDWYIIVTLRTLH